MACLCNKIDTHVMYYHLDQHLYWRLLPAVNSLQKNKYEKNIDLNLKNKFDQ